MNTRATIVKKSIRSLIVVLSIPAMLLTASVGGLHGLIDSPAAREALAVATANDSTLLEPAVAPVAAGEAAGADPGVVRLADELVTRAKQTGARVTFIEDSSLLHDHGGVAALLRFRG